MPSDGTAEYSQEGQGEREGDPYSHAVRLDAVLVAVSRKIVTVDAVAGANDLCSCSICFDRGLDNAGKTTILKKFMGQDITEISPTLGFDIQTLEYKE